MRISTRTLDELQSHYDAAEGRRDKRAVIDNAAIEYCCDRSTILRKLKLEVRAKRQIPPDVLLRRAEEDFLAETVYNFAQSKSHDEKTVDLSLAFDVLKRAKQIPEGMTMKKVYASVARQNLRSQSASLFCRYEKENPREIYQMDFTKSLYLHHVGEQRLRLKAPGHSKRVDPLFLWCGAVIDDCSRVVYAEYFISAGEDTQLAIELAMKAFAEKPNHLFLQGLPEKVYTDRGPGFKADFEMGLTMLVEKKATGDAQYDVRGRRMNKSNSGARGKVERFFKKFKKVFEADIHCSHTAGKEFSLVELNEMLHSWLELVNQTEHPTRQGEGKWNIFAKGLDEARFPISTDSQHFAKIELRLVSRRMVTVGKGRKAIVPDCIHDGDMVEVVQDGRDFYCIWEHKRYALIPQRSSIGEQTQRPQRATITERPDDILEAGKLRERFACEIEETLAMELRDIPEWVWEDVQVWLKEPHTVSDVKEFAHIVRMRLEINAEEISAPDVSPTVRPRATIIQL
jgi:transposase InsO family protein